MTAAEYKTLREALGLSQAEAAGFHGLRALRTVQHWESGRSAVPDGAAAELRGLDRAIDTMVERAVALYREQAAEMGDPEAVELYRYRDPEVYLRSRAGLEGLPIGAHAVLIDRTRRALEAAGAAVAIVYADRPQS